MSYRAARTGPQRGSQHGHTVGRDAQHQQPGPSDSHSLIGSPSGNGLRDSPPTGYGQEAGGRYFGQPMTVEDWLEGNERVFGSTAHQPEGPAEPAHQVHHGNQHEGTSGTSGARDANGRAAVLAQIGSQFGEE